MQNFPLPSAPHYIFCGQDFIDLQGRSSYTSFILKRNFSKNIKEGKWKKKKLFV